MECGKAVPVLCIKRLYLAKKPQYPESATSLNFLSIIRKTTSVWFTKPAGAQLERLPAKLEAGIMALTKFI